MARILLVDPSVTTRVLVMKCLEEDGHHVDETASGREALEACQGLRPDCVIMDLVLQEMDGFKLLRALQEFKPSIPVVVYTQLRMKDLDRQCLDLGAAVFLRKPVPPLNLREQIALVLQGGEQGATPLGSK